MAQVIEILSLQRAGHRLEELRMLGGFTQEEAADLAGYTNGAPSISRIESGTQRLPEQRRKNLANGMAGKGKLTSSAPVLDAYLDGREHDLRECIAPPVPSGGLGSHLANSPTPDLTVIAA